MQILASLGSTRKAFAKQRVSKTFFGQNNIGDIHTKMDNNKKRYRYRWAERCGDICCRCKPSQWTLKKIRNIHIYTLVILRNGKNVENTHKKPVTDKDT